MFVKRIFISLLLLSFLAAGCGDDDEPTGPGAGNKMSANINGQFWESDQSAITITSDSASASQGTMIISGTKLSAGNKNITLELSFISGPGTYPLGVSVLTNAGGRGLYSDPPNSWLTPMTGEAGTVTISTRTDTRIVGTFSFDADEFPGSPPSTVRVTNGKFDITVEGGLPDLPTGIASVTSANLNGDFWNAATIIAYATVPGEFNFAGTTTEFAIAIFPLVPVSAGNTYGIPSQISLTINRIGSTDSWHSDGGPNVGTLTVTEFTDDQLVATFDGVIPQLSGGITPMAITDGQINVFLQPIGEAEINP